MWNWRHEEYGIVERIKAVVGLGGYLENRDLVAAVGMGCEYEECKCVVLSFFGGISDGFETMNLFGINFVWEDWEEKRGCI